MTTCFCDAYASWQKGGIENANGRLRRWLPRHLDIDRTSDQDIQEIVLTTNLTPRKCLGFKTPLQACVPGLDRQAAERRLLVLRLQVGAGLAHHRADAVERSRASVTAERERGCGDRLGPQALRTMHEDSPNLSPDARDGYLSYSLSIVKKRSSTFFARNSSCRANHSFW